MTIEEIKKLKKFEYVCYYCGKHVILTNRQINNLIKKWNNEEQSLEFFNNNIEYNLCSKCAD